MNNKALLQLGSELMFKFRHNDGPADRELADYISTRRFLGSKDKAFISDCFFHALRHLRRIDEAILSAFAGSIAAETRYSSGFPVTQELGARAWLRRDVPEAEEMKPNQSSFDRVVDTLRLGIAAVELGFDNATTVAEEVAQFWPNVRSHVPVQAGSLTRMMERAVEVATLYRQHRKPMDEERAYSFPSWLWARLGEGRGIGSLPPLGAALNEQAPVTLRVNTLNTTVPAAEEVLTEAKIPYEKSSRVATALMLRQRIARQSFPHFNDGWFEVQDEGSQLVSVYTDAVAGNTVIDACAGGGGKSLHLAALMGNEGRIHALDIDAARLFNLGKRARRSGVTIIDDSIALTPEGVPKAVLPKADVVLVDAPCSGLGTMRRSPDIRWRLSSARLEALRETQRQLLEFWAGSVRPGGALVYATCSLLAEENELQVNAFLTANPGWKIVAPAMPADVLTKRGELKLSPDIHGCDGFYAARLIRPV